MRHAALITNGLSAAVAGAGLIWPVADGILLDIGLFALSGAITNWLAVHMLFERVPLLYGSGVIPNNFVTFKSKIRDLMMTEFFTRQGIDQLIASTVPNLDLAPLKASLRQRIDLNNVFETLTTAIMESSFASMLSLFGGKAALEPLRAPMTAKLTEILDNTLADLHLDPALVHVTPSQDWQVALGNVIDSRLDSLTPTMVKEMLQRIIQEHLGWLVIWGGAFGALMGAVYGVAQSIPY